MELNLASSLVWTGLSDVLPKKRAWEVKCSSFTVKKSGSHYLNQVTEVMKNKEGLRNCHDRRKLGRHDD